MTTLLLVRHGENDFVAKKKLAGWLPGVHLNARGRAQAEALAQVIAGHSPQAVYASPLERTLETAEIIARTLGKSVEIVEGLGEVDVGRWQGQSLKALKKRKLWPAIQHTPSLVRFPQGESFQEAQSRVVETLERLRGNHGGEKDIFVCVTHADVIKLAVAYYIGLPLDLFQRLTVEPASISVLRIGQGARLVQLNDTRASEVEGPG
jgi:probable phosphoglycerate mutase